jgi:hypothetical protein
MKPWLFPLFLLLFSTPDRVFAQSAAHDHGASSEPASADAAVFDKLKALAGSWTGELTTTPHVPKISGSPVEFSLRVTSRGNALAHEFSVSGLPDHPLTMFYLDSGRLTLTHYCDAGNRPRLTGKMSPDGKTVEFEFLDLSGGNEGGHMHHAVFTFIDENHHTEDWTFMMPGDRPMRAHFDLRRANLESAAAR